MAAQGIVADGGSTKHFVPLINVASDRALYQL